MFRRSRLPQLVVGSLLMLIVLSLSLGSSTWAAQHSAQWPQWRGPQLDSVSHSDQPVSLQGIDSRLWQVELPGPGGSSPVVWDDSIFVTTVEGIESGDPMSLMAFDRSGKLRWKQALDGENRNVRDNANSASPSPITDGTHVWAMMTNGYLHCFTIDGQLIWKKDLQQEYGEFNIQFGMSSTPVLDQGRLYLQLIHGNMRDRGRTSEGHVVALDAQTGAQIWYHKRLTDGYAENLHSYASPTIYRDQERAFLITHGADYVIGHSLEDGTELWRCGGLNPRGQSYNPTLRFVASPTCIPGIIIIPSAKRGPVLALDPAKLDGDVTENEDAFLWRLQRGTPDVASPVVFDGLVYLAGERGSLTCVDAATGETVYEIERFCAGNHRSTPVVVDDRLIIPGRDGTIYVVQAGHEFKLLNEIKLDQETTASAAVAAGMVYIRTFDALHCFGSKPTSVAAMKEQNADDLQNAEDAQNAEEADRADRANRAAAGSPEVKFAIALHGGAGGNPDRSSAEANARRRASMENALRAGVDILEQGGASLDAVVAVVRILEDDPQFNAGKGAVYNSQRAHELDASIMDGETLACGAVAGVTRVKNPIDLARLVMTDTRHILLAGAEADKFAESKGLEMVENSYFSTRRRRESQERLEQELSHLSAPDRADPKAAYWPEWDLGTVGCVAVDSQGNLAAATSTGGMSNKRIGRIGDSPIIGAGNYADNGTCAVSCTGLGEQFIRHAVAYDIAAQMKYRGVSLQQAVEDNMTNRLNPNDGGLIAVDQAGNIVMEYNSSAMARGAADSNGRFEVFWGNEAVSN